MSLLFCVDTETSALKPTEGGIVELAAVCLRDGQIVDRFSSFVWPGRKWLRPKNRENLAEYCQIDPCRLLDEDVPSATLARALFTRWLCENAGVPVPAERSGWSELDEDAFLDRVPLRLTTYNVEFDRKFLYAPDWVLGEFVRKHTTAEIEWAPCVMLKACEMLGAAGKLQRKRFGGGYLWPSLERSCQEFNIPFTETHRALPDAEAAAALALRLEVE